MKPIENIFNFNCSECEYNRNCYGGNLGNQFRYCRKSTEKIEENEKLQQENQQLKLELSGYRQAILEDKEMLGLQQENQQLKDNWNELKKWLEEELKHYKKHFEFVCKNPSPVPIDDTRIILEKDDLIIQKLEKVLDKIKRLEEGVK